MSRATASDFIRELRELGITIRDDQVLSVVTICERHSSYDDRDAKKKAADRSRAYRNRKRDAASQKKRDGSLSLSSTSLLTDSPRATEEVRKKKRNKSELIPIPADWEPKPQHFAYAKEIGRNAQFVHDKAHAMRHWALGIDARGANWDSRFFKFIRDEAKNGRANGNGHARPQTMTELLDEMNGSHDEQPTNDEPGFDLELTARRI